MYNTDNYLDPLVEPFSSTNCFLFFCSDLAVLVFPTLLADI